MWPTNILLENNKVLFSDVRAVYKIDKQNISMGLLKLTNSHINSNTKKWNVS